MATRLALTATAGLGLSFVDGNTDLTAAFQTTSALAPRAGAVLFSLMVVYPLRSLVAPKEAPLPGKRGRQPADSSKAGPPSSPQSEDDRGLMIVSLSDRVASPEQPKQAPPPASDLFIPAPVPQADIAIEVPISALLAELPREMVTDEARSLDDGRSVALPSDRVLQQLREAHVLLSVQEIIELLPHRMRKTLSQPPDVNLESDTVNIPLELIVPQIPLDAFDLPAPTPPAWAAVEETDGIVFATVPTERGQ
jgi:hypothetical protein